MAYTHILLKFYENNGLDEKTIESLLSEKTFEGISYKYQKFSNDIYKLSIFSQEEKSFEKNRDQLIQFLRKITVYLSISYDSMTKHYIKKIGETIYELERSFRTLIEFVFLKEFNSNWVEAFPTMGHDRKSKRGEPIISLNNPLDDWDFIQLSRFVKEQITIMDQELQRKLKTIEQSIEALDPLSDFDKFRENINQKILEILNFSTKNQKSYKYTEFYSHLTPPLASDWVRLYELRNLWAHNNALITRSEFEQYDKLSKSVLNNLHTEMTLNCLFSEQETKYVDIGGVSDEDSLKVTLYKSNFEGRARVHIKGKFVNETGQNISFRKNSVTFFDILNLYKEILDVVKDTEKLIEVNSYFDNNPFLEKEFIELGKYVANKFESLEQEKSFIQSFLITNGYDVLTDDIKVIMSEDVDLYLRKIFKKNS
jgi:hypothetical protein